MDVALEAKHIMNVFHKVTLLASCLLQGNKFNKMEYYNYEDDWVYA